MHRYWNIREFPRAVAPVLTTGIFDGVHKGHQAMIARLRERAREMGRESALLTFHPHPKTILAPDKPLQLIDTIEERAELLAEEGIDHLIIHPFSQEFASLTAKRYIERILVEELNIAHLVVGTDHRFGKGREGDNHFLGQEAPKHGFTIEEVQPIRIEGHEVGSSLVREALKKGEVAWAKRLMGHSFELTGQVIRGDQRGRDIGFPTANLEVSDPYKIVPGNGVYAVNVKRGNEWYRGMMNIGTRPTVEKEELDRSIEVHIFDLDQDLYGESLTLSFEERIRGEQKFSGMAELQAQLERDRETALGVFGV